MKPKYIILAVSVLLSVMGLVLLNPIAIINAGERGVVLKVGKVDRIMPEGLNWKTPFIEKVQVMDVRTQKIQVNADAASKDLQIVSSTIALNYNLNPDRVGELWREVGKEYQLRIIDPAIQESVKSGTAKFTAEELITKRDEVKSAIREQLKERLATSHIVVTDFNIVNFNFSPQFNSAIEAKVTAEQEALAAKNQLERVKFEAEQRITQAKGEAEAIRIQAQAITQQGGKDYVELKSVEKWDGVLPQYMLGGGAVPFINIGQ